jgi:hypothetical protein
MFYVNVPISFFHRLRQIVATVAMFILAQTSNSRRFLQFVTKLINDASKRYRVLSNSRLIRSKRQLSNYKFAVDFGERRSLTQQHETRINGGVCRREPAYEKLAKGPADDRFSSCTTKTLPAGELNLSVPFLTMNAFR